MTPPHVEVCPAHPNQPAIHCACPDGEAAHPCTVCKHWHTGPTCAQPATDRQETPR